LPPEPRRRRFCFCAATRPPFAATPEPPAIARFVLSFLATLFSRESRFATLFILMRAMRYFALRVAAARLFSAYASFSSGHCHFRHTPIRHCF